MVQVLAFYFYRTSTGSVWDQVAREMPPLWLISIKSRFNVHTHSYIDTSVKPLLDRVYNARVSEVFGWANCV